MIYGFQKYGIIHVSQTDVGYNCNFFVLNKYTKVDQMKSSNIAERTWTFYRSDNFELHPIIQKILIRLK